MVALANISAQRLEILRIARLHGAHSIRLFGSVARGQSVAGSDVDFLVELEPGRSLLDLGGLQVDLEALLKVPVDVATKDLLKDRIRDRVLREAIPL